MVLLSMAVVAGGVLPAHAAETNLPAARAADPAGQAPGTRALFPGTAGPDRRAEADDRQPAPAMAGTVAYVSGTGGEPWGQPGNVNALNDVFGTGNWDRLEFPSAVGNGLFEYDFIFIDGGDGADAEFTTFMNTYRADLETWVDRGGCLLLNAARYSGDVLDLGFGVALMQDYNFDGLAIDTSHPVFDGPFGFTGDTFAGDYLAHDSVAGDGITVLMKGEQGTAILAEQTYGDGHVVF
ncbi:MAG: hypothetical protein SYC29_17250, partial [Planctomycetota bacterium]|nr:hypothetical protein [Planctomycetota bacterium]